MFIFNYYLKVIYDDTKTFTNFILTLSITDNNGSFLLY